MQSKTYPILAILLCALVLSLTAPVRAADNNIPPPNTQNDILPVKSAAEADVRIDESNATDPALNLTPDKSELIRLNRKASVVIVGNPATLSILPEGSNTLVLVPQAPGATYFTVLDEENKVIMQRHVIVASPKEKYIRIRKPCVQGKDCKPVQVYYCPNMCHEIIMNDGTSNAGNAKSGGNAGVTSNDNVQGSADTPSGTADAAADENPNNEPPPAESQGANENTNAE